MHLSCDLLRNNSSRFSQYSLVDEGANGGVAGSDMRVIETYTDRKVDIRGIDNH